MGSLVNVEEEWELENHHFSTTTVNNGSVRMITDVEARGKFWLGTGYWFAPKVSPHGLLIVTRERIAAVLWENWVTA